MHVGVREGRGIAFERWPTDEHLEQHAPKRVQIGAAVHWVPACLLRRDVLGTADDARRRGERLGRQELCDPKIRELDLIPRRDQHVRGLDISMHNVLGVSVGKRRGDAVRDAGGSFGF